jgi:hypothetical protein
MFVYVSLTFLLLLIHRDSDYIALESLEIFRRYDNFHKKLFDALLLKEMLFQSHDQNQDFAHLLVLSSTSKYPATQ